MNSAIFRFRAGAAEGTVEGEVGDREVGFDPRNHADRLQARALKGLLRDTAGDQEAQIFPGEQRLVSRPRIRPAMQVPRRSGEGTGGEEQHAVFVPVAQRRAQRSALCGDAGEACRVNAVRHNAGPSGTGQRCEKGTVPLRAAEDALDALRRAPLDPSDQPLHPWPLPQLGFDHCACSAPPASWLPWRGGKRNGKSMITASQDASNSRSFRGMRSVSTA